MWILAAVTKTRAVIYFWTTHEDDYVYISTQ